MGGCRCARSRSAWRPGRGRSDAATAGLTITRAVSGFSLARDPLRHARRLAGRLRLAVVRATGQLRSRRRSRDWFPQSPSGSNIPNEHLRTGDLPAPGEPASPRTSTRGSAPRAVRASDGHVFSPPGRQPGRSRVRLPWIVLDVALDVAEKRQRGGSSPSVRIGSNLWSWQRAQPTVRPRNAVPVVATMSSSSSNSACRASAGSSSHTPRR